MCSICLRWKPHSWILEGKALAFSRHLWLRATPQPPIWTNSRSLFRVSREECGQLALTAFHSQAFGEKPCSLKEASEGPFPLLPLLPPIPFREQSMSSFFLQATFARPTPTALLNCVPACFRWGKNCFRGVRQFGIWKEGWFCLSPKVGDDCSGRSRLPLAPHQLCWKQGRSGSLPLAVCAEAQRCSSPENLVVLSLFSLLKKMKAKNNGRRPFAASVLPQPLESHFTWVSALNLLQQPDFLYLNSATPLRLFRHLRSMLPFATARSHSHLPCVVCSL